MILTGSDGKEYEFEEALVQTTRFRTLGTLKPIDKEWPQDGDKYWYIDSDGCVEYSTWRMYFDRDVLGGIYRTQEEAQHVADRIRSLKDAIVDEIEDTPLLDHYKRVCLYIDKKYLKAWEYLESEEK